MNTVTCNPLHTALATMTPCLHIGFCKVACVCGRLLCRDRDNGLGQRDAAGDFPVRVSYAFD